MLFTARNSAAIRAGAVTVSYRNWQRPQAKLGGVYRLRPEGAVRVTDVCTVRLDEVEAARTRLEPASPPWTRWRCFLKLPLGATVTKVEFELASDEQRAAPPTLSVEQALERLYAMDRRSATPWAVSAVLLIRANPATRAADLAPALVSRRRSSRPTSASSRRLALRAA